MSKAAAEKKPPWKKAVYPKFHQRHSFYKFYYRELENEGHKAIYNKVLKWSIHLLAQWAANPTQAQYQARKARGPPRGPVSSLLGPSGQEFAQPPLNVTPDGLG